MPVCVFIIFSFFSLLLLSQSPAYRLSRTFFNGFFLSSRDRLFVLPLFLVVFSGWEITWSMVSVACYLMALVLAIYICIFFDFLMMVVNVIFNMFF